MENNDVKIVTIGTLKGGVGKSTLLFNIAGELAKEQKVLVIDLDPQFNSTLNFGISAKDISNSTKNIFVDKKAPALIVKKGLIEGLNMDILPTTIFLTETEMQLVSQAGRERILLRYFSEYYDFFNNYDYVLIDTNPSMSVINQNAFVVADSVLLVTEASVNALSGASLFIDLWEDITANLLMESNVKGVIINKFESRENSTKEFLNFLKSNKSNASNLLLDAKISKAVAIKDSTELDNIPITLKSGKGVDKVKKDILNLVQELKEKEIL